MEAINKVNRDKKISELLALITGELAPDAIRSKKQLIAIDWGEECGEDDLSIFMINGKKVNRDTFNKELLWRTENKK
jgi:hypothetical protein